MLVVQDLTFGFRHRPLFRGLGFRVGRGELVHLAGPNGAGKSTLMAIVAGLLAPESGTIVVEPAGPEGDRRRYLEYLPAEANGLFLKMDAMENLSFWCRLRGVAVTEESLRGALAPWDLDHPLIRDDFPVEKFSTGMKRRLALARLTLSSAPCWLLDEPLYGLDQSAIKGFRQALERKLADGGAVLVVSHELAPFEGLITRQIEIGGGKA